MALGKGEFFKTLLQRLVTPNFEWKNLPPGLTNFNLENQLIIKGQVVVFPIGEKWIAENYAMKNFDIYRNPSRVEVVSINPTLSGMIIENAYFHYLYNNSTKTTSLSLVETWLPKLEYVCEIIEENLGFNKLNIILTNTGGKISEKKAEEIRRAILGNKSVIELDINTVKNLSSLKQIGIENNASLLIETFIFYWNIVCKTMGIEIVESNYKKANIQKEEINTSLSIPQRIIEEQLQQRKDFLERIKIAFPQQWEKVEVNYRFENNNQISNNVKKEVDNNEPKD